MFTAYLVQIINSGLALGAVYGLMALGFALVYNSSRLINFAQGELLLLAGLSIYSLVQYVGANPVWGVFGAVACGFGLGHLLYATTLGLCLSASPLRQLMLTVAASLTWQGAAILIWGKKPLMLPELLPLPAVRLGKFYLSQYSLNSLVLAACCAGLLGLFLRYSRLGRAIRAVSMNAVAARLQGINPRSCHALSFALSGGLAALAALAIGPQTMLRYDMGLGLGLKGFVAASLGGYTSLPRVLAAGLALGFIEACLVLAFSTEVKESVSYVLLILILLASPAREHGAQRA